MTPPSVATNFSIKTSQLDFPRLAERLSEVMEKRRFPKIAVVGNYCLDKYLYRAPNLDELSVETGKTAFQIRDKKVFAGVGGTIANNLRTLGAQTFCFGVVGEDGDGFDLLNALKRNGCDVSGIVVSSQILTGTYVKPMTPASDGGWEEENRFDIRNSGPVPTSDVDELKRRFREQIDNFDAVVVSDQFPPGSEAIFSADFRAFLAEIAAENPHVFFLCDSRFFAETYREALVKCNANELLDVAAALATGCKNRETTLDGDSEGKIEELCRAGVLLARRNRRPVLATRGSSGSLLFDVSANSLPCSGSKFESENKETTELFDVDIFAIPPIPVAPPLDVCGAGDATNAGFAFAKSLGFSLVESAFLAGVASSITIRQIGVTGTASIPQILDVLSQF